MAAKFDFFEVIKISSRDKALFEVNGLEGAILGMVVNDVGSWIYSVQIFSLEENYDISERDLLPNGKMMSEQDFYDGDSVAVLVDSISGEGDLKT